MTNAKFTYSLAPTQFDLDEGYDNIFVERSEGRLPVELHVEAEPYIDAAGVYCAHIISVTDSDGSPIDRDLLLLRDDAGTALIEALEARAVKIAFDFEPMGIYA